MLIQRVIQQDITKKLQESNKAIIIYGPRQVGKTTLCKEIIQQLGYKTLAINADEQRYIDVLSSRDSRVLLELVAGYDLLFIDEAQRIPDIGINLKILIDQKPTLKIIVTGSSSFELANHVSEPLTGRAWTYTLFPIAQVELQKYHNRFELNSAIEERLLWGSYPNIFHLEGIETKTRYMQQLVSNYLYKDILIMQKIRHADKLKQLLKLLAFQIGQEVSLSELATRLEMSKETVGRYIDLLQKTFVIFSLGGFSKNLRNEVTKMNKYYFYDLGVRNALIENFQPLNSRNDVGHLWENFLIIERMKRNQYKNQFKSSYFWRIYNGSEIDYVEEGNGELNGFEIKWQQKKQRVPKTWSTEYPDATWELITKENWLDFVLEPMK